MFHLAAYIHATTPATDVDQPALSDDILTIQNNHFVLQTPMSLIAAAAMSATLTRARLASPSMRQIANPYIRPINVAAIPAANPNMWLLDYNPFRIPPFEEVQALLTAAPAMTEPAATLIWLQDQMTPMPSGNCIPLRVTSTTAAVANTWTSLTITWQDTIPTGRYAMVLSECSSTNARAHRWIFSNQLWRPGHLSFAAVGSRLPYAVSKGQFGLMGFFNSNDLPRLQVLVNGTDNAHEIYAHVIRTGNIYGG